MIYLDNSMAAKPSEKTVSEMMPWLLEKWGAPESPHCFGHHTKKAIKESLSALYSLLRASFDDTIIFTSSGAEAINQIMTGIFFTYIQESGRNHILVSALDELPAFLAAKRLEALGCSCRVISGEKRGFVSKKSIESHITARTILVSVGFANGLTGVVNPIEEISKLCEERGIFLHVDATHALGKIPMDCKPSFITFRGEPLHAPQGTGALYIKNGVRAESLILGGQEQGGLRGGSFSIANLAGLGMAAIELLESQDYMNTEIARIRALFEDAINEAIPGAAVLFSEEERVPHITAISFPYVSSELLLYHLNHENVYACIGGGDFQPLSQVLKACFVPMENAQSAISFSLSRYTKEEDVLKAAVLIKKAYDKLKTASKVFF